jgi:monovalent cation/hydrogen antiporter
MHLELQDGLVALGLILAVATMLAIAPTLRIPYPILLVIGGLALGVVPGMPEFELQPELVFYGVLPPLLYSSAFFTSLRELRVSARPIGLLAVGLVVVTTVGVAVVAHEFIEGLSWSSAFVLGAIVSPTDPVAATSIARRFGVPAKLVRIVEGESLVNDGTGLVLYRVAVAAVVAGSFSAYYTAGLFVVSAGGGIAVGLIVGWLIRQIRRRLDNPPAEITISLLTGYVAFIPADLMGVSAVLAAVTAGVYLGWHTPELTNAQVRLQGVAVWEIVQYLLNALLFVLIGLQLPGILDNLSDMPAATLLGYAAAVSATVVVMRLLWVLTVPYLIRLVDRRASQVERRVGLRERIVAGWSGMRGAVSLAAALAIPFTAEGDTPFPQRDLIIFLTFAVIFTTLVLQGLTLPALIRKLNVVDDGEEEEREELMARLNAADAALAQLERLAEEEWTRDDTVERMRAMYDYRRRRFGARAGHVEDDGYEDRSVAYQRMVLAVLEAQRQEIVMLRNHGEISNEVMHRLERELDLEASRLEIEGGPQPGRP